MVDRTAGSGRGFFQTPEAGSGLASVQDAAAGSFHRADISVSEGRDAAQTLKEVQRGALAGEQHARGTSNPGDFVARVEVVTGAPDQIHGAGAGREFLEDHRKQ